MQVYGIDLAKEKFDVNFVNEKGEHKRRTVKNSMAQISVFLEGLPSTAVLCAEHTGTYGDLLVWLCNQYNVRIALVSGYSVKHSLGLVKGKTDPMDAGRLREYGERFFDKLSFRQYHSESMSELRQLSTLRSQMVKARKELRTGSHAREMMPMQSLGAKRSLSTVLKCMDGQIFEIEVQIAQIIAGDREMAENYVLATSVKGVGPVIATDMIIKTGNFRTIDTARKAASYAGVCPFPNSSGKMVAKSRTVPFADKELKSLLYMGATSAVKHNKEYNLYYQRKVLEGKQHYLIMNNIANKMLKTIYSILKSRKPYSQDHMCLDPRENKIDRSKKNVA